MSTVGPRVVSQLATHTLIPQYASDVLQRTGAMAEALKLLRRVGKPSKGDTERVCGLLELGLNDKGSAALLATVMDPKSTIADVRLVLLGSADVPEDEAPAKA